MQELVLNLEPVEVFECVTSSEALQHNAVHVPQVFNILSGRGKYPTIYRDPELYVK
jgi:hypothetical protein